MNQALYAHMNNKRKMKKKKKNVVPSCTYQKKTQEGVRGPSEAIWTETLASRDLH
jgi:hypothetical protein